MFKFKMTSIICDNGCGTFFMNGREYYNICGKSYEGHSPMCGHLNYIENDTITVKLVGDYNQDTFKDFDIAIFIPKINSVIIHRLDRFPFLNFCESRKIKIELSMV